MASHTFSIFQDRSRRKPVMMLQATRRTHHAMSSNASVDDTDKENVNPSTGECAVQSKYKKRKTAGLSTKSHAPLATKGQVKPTLTNRQNNSKSLTSRKGRKSSTRSHCGGSHLSPIDEEWESEREIARIRLADIESRCYELTEKPLADLSEAFGCPRPFIREGRATDEDEEMSTDKDYVFNLDPCDYLIPVPPTPPTTPTKTFPRHATSFSTPERKLLFAAFSFSSPSPSSERFKKAKSVGNGSTRASSSL